MRLAQFLNVALVASLAGSCTDLRDPAESDSRSSESAIVEISGDACAPLMAGSDIAGTVCTSIVGADLKVTFETSGDWRMVDARLWVGTDVPGFLGNNQYPLLFQFPYQSGSLDQVTRYEFLVPLARDGSLDCAPKTLYIIAKAGLYAPTGAFATAWAGDMPIAYTGRYFDISLTCDDDPPDDLPITCETAFAYGEGRSMCFLEFEGLKPNRWGGTIGPLDSGTYDFQLYAGAGRCDLDKATFVGWVHVEHDYAAGTRVCFDAAPGASFEETHLYVGNSPLPSDKKGGYSVSPGLYPYSHELTGGATHDCFEVEVGGYVYVVAHAVACYGEDPGTDIDDGYAGGIQR